jgi:hypothetical protein
MAYSVDLFSGDLRSLHEIWQVSQVFAQTGKCSKPNQSGDKLVCHDEAFSLGVSL